MADIHKFSEQLIDFGERLSDVADAVQGKGRRSGNGTTRWFVLPAVGAGLYALLKSEFFTRQAKDVVDEAKTRASELPNDLLNTVHQTSQQSSASTSGGQRRRQPSRRSASRGGGQRGRKTSTARKTSARR